MTTQHWSDPIQDRIAPEHVEWLVKKSRIFSPPPTVIELKYASGKIERVQIHWNNPWTQDPINRPPRPETAEEILQRLNNTPARMSDKIWFKEEIADHSDKHPTFVTEKIISVNGGVMDEKKLIGILLEKEVKKHDPLVEVNISGHSGTLVAGSKKIRALHREYTENLAYTVWKCEQRQAIEQACAENTEVLIPATRPSFKR